MWSQPLQEMANIVEANVDTDVGMASSWARLDALDSVSGTDLTPGWDIEPGASADHYLLANEVTSAKPQSNKGKGRCSIYFPSSRELMMEETPTPEQPSTFKIHVEPKGVDQGLPGWAALGIPYDIESLRDVY
ncbi:hypothetical protein R1flu_025077 [Riccia fluitans]|uniref:Uncharacterized protein n=1 Tax=Riccia fluitans TaxID=41844 RepID=A0ABD1XWQ3_9MARC